ncbi:MAG: hypothetical protein JNK26_00760 [Candidatus Doudnabacteria bacterium]|nr:hypothetical protein [Candidatus Doudnabacteria bacterium]
MKYFMWILTAICGVVVFAAVALLLMFLSSYYVLTETNIRFNELKVGTVVQGTNLQLVDIGDRDFFFKNTVTGEVLKGQNATKKGVTEYDFRIWDDSYAIVSLYERTFLVTENSVAFNDGTRFEYNIYEILENGSQIDPGVDFFRLDGGRVYRNAVTVKGMYTKHRLSMNGGGFVQATDPLTALLLSRGFGWLLPANIGVR